MHNIMNDEAMFYVGETPWHGLGTELNIPPSTEEALVQAGLDWQVHKSETYVINGETKPTGYHCTYRYDKNGEFLPLGNVSERYEVLQNLEAFQPFDEVLLEKGYTYETAGALGNGEKIWILAKRPNVDSINKDELQSYMLLYNSHDGSSGIVIRPTVVRVVCQNTLDFSLDSKGTKLTIKHTANARERLDDFTQVLQANEGDIDTAITIMRDFYITKLNESQVVEYFESVFPAIKYRNALSINPLTGRKAPNFSKPQFERLMHNYTYGKGNNGRTMYDAYNAVTEYVDHCKNYNNRMKSIGFGWGYKTKKVAFDVAKEMVLN